MKSKVITTSTGKVWLDEEGIIRETEDAGSSVDLNAAKEIIAAYAALCKNELKPILVDIRNIKSITAEARGYLAGEGGAKFTRAVALLIDSPLSRIIGNSFLGLNKPSFPTRLFTTKEQALIWLRGFL